MDDAAMQVPELVPARMLNEFAYCPRLFFIEWVQGRFEDNLETTEGREHHRRVDKPTGRAPSPGTEPLHAARAVQLSSPDLGIVAKIDLIEGIDGRVRPVDTKRGTPPDTPERSWEPERVQVCAQGLLLREAGYDCDEGVLYFAGSRERVVVRFDDALVERTRDLLTSLRAVAAVDTPPLPLVDSPKCPRCSLVGICLPDETNALAERSDLPVRRLLPRQPAARPLYVTTPGARLGRTKNRIQVKVKDEVIDEIRLIDVSQVNLHGNVQISSQLLRDLFTRDIPVCWFSHGGWFSGMATGLPSKHVELRRRQVAASATRSLDVARAMIAGKIRNSRTLLRRNARVGVTTALDRLRRAADEATSARRIDSLLGVEGAAARTYFSAFPAMLSTRERLPGLPFSFEGRNRRPPRDPVNCLLSYAYSLLVKDLSAAAFGIGFDPYLGFYHRPRFGRPALALDLAEEFRPLIAESVVVGLINNGEVAASDFVVRAGGVGLTPDGRRAALRAHERRLDAEVTHPTFGYRVTYRRVLEVQCRLLAAHLLDEVPEYTAFTTR